MDKYNLVKNSLADLIDEHHALTLRRNDLDAIAANKLDPKDPAAEIRIVIDTEEFVFKEKHYRVMKSIVVSALRDFYRTLDQALLIEIEDAK